jgi:Fe2+ transport system protein FeoA
MENKKVLSEIQQGKKAKVIGFDHHGSSFSRHRHAFAHMHESIDSARHVSFFVRRLQEMGVIPGSVVEVLKNSFLGPVEISVKGSKLAIGRGIASKIVVEEIDE